MIGIITMFCDHVSDSIIGHFTYLNYIGRIAFPIFAFQLVQGYLHTKNLKKYFIRLLIFACISQIPFMLFLSTFSNSYYLNIFFTLFLGAISIYVYNKADNKYLGIALVALICIIGHFVQVDYGAYGVLIIFIFFVFRNKKIFMYLSFILATILKYLPNIIRYSQASALYIGCILFTCISLIPIFLYNGKQGPKVKYLFYIFYPLHLLILYFLRIIIY